MAVVEAELPQVVPVSPELSEQVAVVEAELLQVQGLPLEQVVLAVVAEAVELPQVVPVSPVQVVLVVAVVEAELLLEQLPHQMP